MRIETDVVIVGGGISGCLAAIHLHKQHPDLRITIIEKSPTNISRGIAYADHFDRQLLNVPVIGMSLYPETPAHFLNWIDANAGKYPGLTYHAQAFIPRSIFGDYALEEFNRVRTLGKIDLVRAEALSVTEEFQGIHLNCSDTIEVNSTFLLIATGNLPPADISVHNKSFLQSPRYFGYPWEKGLPDRLTKNENILIVGSGLTAVDLVLALHHQKHAGKIHMLSRRGYLPLPHAPHQNYVFSNPSGLLSGNIHTVMKTIRDEITLQRPNGIHWQNVMDALRIYTTDIWRSLDEKGRKIFLSRLRPFWEIHRHRIPIESLNILNEMKKTGILIHHTGFIENAFDAGNEAKVVFRHKGKEKQLIVSKVINCTGPENNFRKKNHSLLLNMMEKGLIRSHPSNLGIDCNVEGKIIRADHTVAEQIFCIGSLRKAILWESTALREIRAQAVELSLLLRKNGVSVVSC